MARTGWGSTNYLRSSNTTPVTAVPLTVATWFNLASTAATKYLFGIVNISSNSGRNLFAVRTDTSPSVQASVADGTTLNSATSSTTFSTGAWNHGCAVFASSTDRRAFLNGGGKGTNSTSRTPSSINRIDIGAQAQATTTAACGSGDILAESAIWNIALSDAEVALLANGCAPYMVRPDALVFYAPLIGQYSPEIDLIGARGLTINGSLSAAAHPRVFYYAGRRNVSFHAGATSPNINLTGIVGTGNPGVFFPTISPAMTGLAGTSALGTLAIDFPVGVNVSAVFGTGSAGTFVPTIATALSGQSGTGAAGGYTPVVSQLLPGLAGTSALGALSDSLSPNISLTGLAGTGQLGAISPSIPSAGASSVHLLALLKVQPLSAATETFYILDENGTDAILDEAGDHILQEAA